MSAQSNRLPPSPAADDRVFFERAPWRRYRARSCRDWELFPKVAPFCEGSSDWEGGAVNLVIVRQIRPGVRIRHFFAVARPTPLNSDREIKRFLRSRGIDPNAKAEIPRAERSK